MDPSIFRWYSADMTQSEYFRYTPKSVFLYFAGFLVGFYLFFRLCYEQQVRILILLNITFNNLHKTLNFRKKCKRNVLMERFFGGIVNKAALSMLLVMEDQLRV